MGEGIGVTMAYIPLANMSKPTGRAVGRHDRSARSAGRFGRFRRFGRSVRFTRSVGSADCGDRSVRLRSIGRSARSCSRALRSVQSVGSVGSGGRCGRCGRFGRCGRCGRCGGALRSVCQSSWSIRSSGGGVLRRAVPSVDFGRSAGLFGRWVAVESVGQSVRPIRSVGRSARAAKHSVRHSAQPVKRPVGRFDRSAATSGLDYCMAC